MKIIELFDPERKKKQNVQEVYGKHTKRVIQVFGKKRQEESKQQKNQKKSRRRDHVNASEVTATIFTPALHVELNAFWHTNDGRRCRNGYNMPQPRNTQRFAQTSARRWQRQWQHQTITLFGWVRKHKTKNRKKSPQKNNLLLMLKKKEKPRKSGKNRLLKI